MRITKEAAISMLFELEESEVLNEKLSDKLSDIRLCLEDDLQYNIDTFGGDNEDMFELYAYVMNPYESSPEFNTQEARDRYDEHERRCREIIEKYRRKEE